MGSPPTFRSLCSLLLLTSIAGCAPNLEERTGQFIAAHNGGDIEAALTFFAEDARCGLMGEWSGTEGEAIRQLEEWKVAVNSRLYPGELSLIGDTVSFGWVDGFGFACIDRTKSAISCADVSHE